MDTQSETEFRYLRTDVVVDWTTVIATLATPDSASADAIFDAMNLADSASAFFRGIFSIEAPYALWGKGIYLPWSDEYVLSRPDSNLLVEVPIGKEVSRIALELQASRGTDTSEPWRQHTYSSVMLSSSKKLTVQGLAVETLLSLDEYLHLLRQQEFALAIPWLTSAYQNIFECTCHAHLLLTEVDEPAYPTKAMPGRAQRSQPWRRHRRSV